MKYFYKYKVLSENNAGKRKQRLMRADNPAHLFKRFKELHKTEKIVKWESVEDS